MSGEFYCLTPPQFIEMVHELRARISTLEAEALDRQQRLADATRDVLRLAGERDAARRRGDDNWQAALDEQTARLATMKERDSAIRERDEARQDIKAVREALDASIDDNNAMRYEAAGSRDLLAVIIHEEWLDGTSIGDLVKRHLDRIEAGGSTPKGQDP